MEEFLNQYGRTLILIGICINMLFQFFITIKAMFKANKNDEPMPANYIIGLGFIMAVSFAIMHLWDNRINYIDLLGSGNNIFIFSSAILLIIAIVNFFIPRKLNNLKKSQ